MSTITILDAVLVTGVSGIIQSAKSKKTFQAKVVGTGAVTASIDIGVSNDGVNFETAGTIQLSGTTSDHDGLALDAPWPYIQLNVTAITGTGAAVTATMSSEK